MDDLMRRLTSRRALLTGAAGLTLAACSSTQPSTDGSNQPVRRGDSGPARSDEFRADEIAGAVEGFFGSTAQSAAEVVAKVFGDLGRPNAYIAGEEASAALGVGLRYGEGWLYRKTSNPLQVFWTGPSVGFDAGVNASKCFTLVYDLNDENKLFQRFPGAEGSFYFVAGIGVNYLRADGITLAPMRTGLGARAGVNIGYMSLTRERAWIPL